MKSDFIIALTQLAAERNLPRDKVMSAIEAALVSAFKKDSVTEGRNVSVRLDPGSGDIEVDIVKTVVDVVDDPLIEMTLEDARENYLKTAEVGDTIKTENVPNSAGRIAAQTAKQVVLQRLREAEREIVLSEYEGREGEIFTVTIQRVESTKIIVDTGRTEAILPVSQQVPNERYRQGTKIKVVLQNIDKDSLRGPELIVSRADEVLLQKLFEQEVPEISNGSVEIINIARECGSRSKVAVRAKQDGVDPVGSCVGLRGVRIQSIVNELQGEKIDILEWNSDTNKYIQNALSPSQVLRVDVNAENGNAVAVVPDRHLSLAIGKEGQNARLAAKLCGLKIDIKSDMDVDLEALKKQEELESEKKENTAVDVAEQESIQDAKPDEVENVTEQADSTKSEEIITTERAVDEDAILAAMIAEEENEIATLGLSPEEELMLFEEEEIVEEDDGEASGSEIADLPEDIWSIHRAGLNQEQAGVIRFAEDIEDLHGGVTARRGKRAPSVPSSNRNKRPSNKKGRSSK
tara:strand:- start:2380 stop:3939 length:1560 start_codon:yes stop_codon:yes gene_type:complete